MKIRKCKICDKLITSNAFGMHLKKHNITTEEYYIKYLDGIRHTCPNCGSDNLKFYGIDKGYSKFCSKLCASKSDEPNKLRQKTCLEKYGVNNVMRNSDVKSKLKDSINKKYNVDYTFQSEEIKKKIKQSNLKKYGVEHPSKSKIIREKTKNSFKKKYGVDNPMKCDEVKKKYIETCKSKYNIENVACLEDVKNKINKSRSVSIYKRLINTDRLKGLVIPVFDLNDYNGHLCFHEWKCVKCGSVFEDHLDNGNIPRCVVCYPKLGYNTSSYEIEISEWLTSLNVDHEINVRSLITPYELDIYIPKYKLAVEFNGLYWHNDDRGIDENYHLNKTKMCDNIGIELIHIFENEWINKKDIIKWIILNKLEIFEREIDIDNCVINNIDMNERIEFLENNHILGDIDGTCFGLYHNDELISCIILIDNIIVRHCVKKHVNVKYSFERLIDYIIEVMNLNSIQIYHDLKYGNGQLYIDCEFEHISDTSPNQIYIRNGKLTELEFNVYHSFLSEYENIKLNSYSITWDCGVNIYERRVNKS